MTKSWDDMTGHEKLEILWRAMAQIHATQNALASDLEGTWDALKETKSELGRIAKDVGTLRALAPKRYSRAG
jgi:hypothetical protein